MSLTASSSYCVDAIVQRQLHCVAAEMYSCSRTATAAAVTAPFLRSCAVGHRVLPELEVTPPSSISPLFGLTLSNRQRSAAFSNVHGVWSARSQSWHRVSASSSTLYAPHANLRSATVQAAGVSPCTIKDCPCESKPQNAGKGVIPWYVCS